MNAGLDVSDKGSMIERSKALPQEITTLLSSIRPQFSEGTQHLTTESGDVTVVPKHDRLYIFWGPFTASYGLMQEANGDIYFFSHRYGAGGGRLPEKGHMLNELVQEIEDLGGDDYLGDEASNIMKEMELMKSVLEGVQKAVSSDLSEVDDVIDETQTTLNA